MAPDATGKVGGGPRRMIPLLGVTTLVLVAGPPRVWSAAAGGAHLKPPDRVEVSITDDTFTLQWAGSGDPGSNVTFSADYQTLQMNDWTKLPGCQRVASTNCDFSSLKISVYDEIKLRIRAEEGNRTSPWRELGPFIPYEEARIGPPKVHLEAEDKAIIISISPPGGKDGLMWAMDKSRFRYIIVSWESASGAQRTRETEYPRYLMSNLSPETTYCVKVKARLYLWRRPALESPVYCVNTTVENAEKLPAPENVQVSGKEQVYVLQWNHTLENVTFQAQWLYAFLKKTEDYEAKWALVPNCENVRTARCVFPRNTFGKGIYFLRVRASHGNRTSPWSEEKEFDTESQTVIPAPAMVLKAVNSSSLRVYVGSQSKSALQRYPLTYEIIFWEKTSNAERKMVEKRSDFTVANLKALTVYCVRARALLQSRKWNSSSDFGETACERTKPGKSPSIWLVAVTCAVFAVPVAVCALQCLRRLIDYVFFPNHVPPSAINEYISEQSLKNILLSTSEEETEKCFIIENTDTVTTVEETNQTDEGHKTYNSQTSEDSGNYSNEDENSGSRASSDLGQEGSVWQA